MENPRGAMKMIRWQHKLDNRVNFIDVSYGNQEKRKYRIRELSIKSLTISWQDDEDSLWIRFKGDGVAHENITNDPFHPVNNGWRKPPSKSENDQAIRKRVTACVKFYALYYRDHIKRKKDVIEFLGLPEIFTWYSGGIGLPDKKDISESWIACFHNRADAAKGYDILKALIVDNEFNWPTGTPGWHYRTWSVLEQMYAKLNASG
jgi:hypothetical protein